MKQPGDPFDRAGKADTERRAGNPDDAKSAQSHGPPLLHLVCDFLAVLDLIRDGGDVSLDVADLIDDLIHSPMNDRALFVGFTTS